MGVISWIVLGGLAGWIASLIVNKTGEGLLRDIILGIIGGVIGGWIFAAVGSTGVTGFNLWSLFVAIVGAVIYAGGAKKVSDFEAACPNRMCPGGPAQQQEANDARNQQNLGGVVLGLGIAGIGAGLIWYLTSTPSSSPAPAPARASLTPVVGSGFGGLSLSGHF